MTRVIARALRHGLVASGLCVLIAIATGVSGYVFNDRSLAAQVGVVVPSEPGATSSQQILSRVLRPWTDAAAPVIAAKVGEFAPMSAAGSAAGSEPLSTSAAAAAPVSVQLVERAVSVEPSGQASPADGGDEVVRAQRIVPRETPQGAPAVRLVPGDRMRVTVSFYYCESLAGYPAGDGGGFCGRGRDGSVVRSGMAACDVAYLGQRFRITGDPTARVYVCADTGSAVHGLHRDIWFLDNRTGWLWQSQVGTSATIEVLP